MEERILKEKEFHNQTFGGANDARQRANEKYYSITKSIIDHYSAILKSRCRDKRVLEYGCGLSAYSYFTIHHGAAQAIGVDISEVAIRQAEQRAVQEGIADRMKFLVMNAEQLEFPDRTFDMIIGNGIIHHLDVDKAYAELARTLKSDGLAVFTEPLGHNPFINLFRRLTPHLRTEDEHPLTMSDVGRAKRFFDGVEARYFFMFTLLAIPFRRLRLFAPLVGLLDRLDQACFRLLPFTRRYAWMVCLELTGPRPGLQSGAQRAA